METDVTTAESKTKTSTTTAPTSDEQNIGEPQKDNNLTAANVGIEVSKSEDTPNVDEKPIAVKTEKKKRLTLQERLALAAQKKSESKSKNKNKKKEVKTDLEKKSKEDELGKSDENVTNKKQTEDTNDGPSGQNNKNVDYLNTLLPDSVNDQQRQDIINQLEKYITTKIEEFQKLHQSEIAKLETDLKIAKSNSNKNLSNNDNNNELINKLKEKEKQVADLLEEGTKLSKRELALNQSVKKLKQREAELEEDLEHNEKLVEDLTSKVETLEKKVVDFDENERTLVEEKLALQTLRTKYDSLVRANDSLTDELKEIKFSKLDVQLEKALKDLDAERKKYIEINDKYEKLTIEFNKSTEEKQAIITDLENQLRIEKTKCADISRESESEIKRLGEKIEALRFQNESTISTGGKSSEDIEVIQMQYDQAQENWKVIESSYLKKISNFEVQIEELRNSNMVYSKKNKVLSNDLKQKSSTLSELQENEENLSNEIELLKKKIQTLTSTNETLEENVKNFKDEFNKEKESFERKVKTLEEEKEGLEASLKLRSEEFNLTSPSTTQLNQNSFYLQDLSSSSSLHFKAPNTVGGLYHHSSMARSASNKKFSVAFGESSTTPRNSSFSFHKLNSIGSMTPQDRILRHQNSIISNDPNEQQQQQQQSQPTQAPVGLNISAMSNYDAFPSANNSISGTTPYLMDSPSLNNLSASQQDFFLNEDMPLGMEAGGSEHVSTINGSNSHPANNNSNAGLNIQLIKKLGAHVRVLELEVSTLKDDAKKLEEEKEAASEEILRLIEENGQVGKIREEVKQKETEIATIQSNYERVLVLLGEKEERVGELTADVDDLKDMLRQQVQQMVDMQDKITELSSKK